MQDTHSSDPIARDATGSILKDPALTLFQKVLLTTDGTVTQLLELYTGQAVRVHKLGQVIAPDVASAALQTAAGELILNRRILLRTEQSHLLYAESRFVMARLPAGVQTQLIETDRPIGLLWREHHMETYREIIRQERAPAGELATHFALDAHATLLSRCYLIYHHDQPLGMITEKFPIDYFR
jgi:chorismate-pyruvate lyase